MSDIQEFTKKIIDYRDARDWRQFHNPKDCAISLSLEASEVLEHFQWKNAAEMQEHIRQHSDEIGHELADVLYWVLILAHDMKIDLKKAFEEKMRINEAKYPVAKAKGQHTKYTKLK